jgi:hypothetical protein
MKALYCLNHMPLDATQRCLGSAFAPVEGSTGDQYCFVAAMHTPDALMCLGGRPLCDAWHVSSGVLLGPAHAEDL